VSSNLNPMAPPKCRGISIYRQSSPWKSKNLSKNTMTII
jgi:hypothetical protein